MHRISSIIFPGLFMLLAFGASIRSCYQSYEYPYPKVSGEVKEKYMLSIQKPRPISEIFIIETLENGRQEKHEWPNPKFMSDSSFEAQKAWRSKIKQQLAFNYVAYPEGQEEAFGQYQATQDTKGNIVRDTLSISDTTAVVFNQGVYTFESVGFEVAKGDSTFLLYGLTKDELAEVSKGEEVTAYYSDLKVEDGLKAIGVLVDINPLIGPWKRTDKNEWMLFAFFGVFSLVVFAIALSKGGTER